MPATCYRSVPVLMDEVGLSTTIHSSAARAIDGDANLETAGPGYRPIDIGLS